jgi:hypothetical protein
LSRLQRLAYRGAIWRWWFQLMGFPLRWRISQEIRRSVKPSKHVRFLLLDTIIPLKGALNGTFENIIVSL